MEISHPAVLTRDVRIPMNQVGGDIAALILSALKKYEGRCIEEGYLKLGSVHVINYSCGMMEGIHVIISVVFECHIINPLVGQAISCIVESNTKAGIKGRLHAKESPFIIFLARDHHHTHETFSTYKEGDKVNVKIIGKRYEINDPKISIIGVLDDTYLEPPDPVEIVPVKPPTPEKPVPESDDSESDAEDADVLAFYSGSKDAYPGKGVHESVSEPKSYDALSKVKGWREKFSNFDVAPFKWSGAGVLPIPFEEGTSWNSIEHAFQGSKFKLYGKDKEAARFTLLNDIGKGDGAFAQKHRKLVVLKDMSAWDEISDQVMADIAKAKYTQNKEHLRVLDLTNDAKLVHIVKSRGKPSELKHFVHLEEIRKQNRL
jgi:DNA-directed RNA polymerase subunit E'/Rpb7/predicted NAD-dependent protein-ADP-ribosyltransferase YbiA (DUF1768 family)